MTRMGQDDHVRGLLNSRSARSGVPAAFSPTSTADAFSLVSPRPGLYISPRFTERSESPSCYSRSQMSLDDSCSDISDDQPTTSSTYRSRYNPRDDKYNSYVDPMRDSSEDERTDSHSDVQASGSNDTLSDAGMLRPVESDTSVSTALSSETTTDPRMSYLGPKTRLISKPPWEEGGGADEEAVSDTEAADTLSMFAGKFKGRSRSRTLTQCKAEMERFLGGGWGRTSSDTRPSMDSSKRSIDSYVQTPLSPMNGSFSDAIRGVGARTPSLFSASSATSSSTQSGIRPRGGSSGAALQINAYHLDSRGTSPVSSSPTTPNFVHPYANLELLSASACRDGEASPSRSNSSATLTASTVSSYVTPSSTSSSATLPEQHEQPSNSKKEKHRPPHIAVLPLNRPGPYVNSAKSPSALSISFVPLSPTSMSSTSAAPEDPSPGMRVFPGSPAYNLISLEQAQHNQMRARERSRSITSNTSQNPISPRTKEVVHKKSRPVLGPVGGGFSSTIAGGSPSPHRNAEDARVRTVSAGSAPRGRPRGYTATSIASQSTTSVNIIPGAGIENIPEPRSTGQTGTPMETIPPRQLKGKRSGFLKFFKNGSSPGHPNISSPITPMHISHNGVDLPPVPKVPAQYQMPKASSPPELGARRELPPVVVSPAHGRAQSLERSQSVSDDSHTSIEDHQGHRYQQHRSNTEPLKSLEDVASPQDPSFGSLKLRPVSSVFKGMPEDYLTGSPKVANSRGSDESRNGDSSGFEEPNVSSPATPYFPQSARSCRTHVSTASSGSDAFSSSVDPRTPSSLVFPAGVPRSSTESQTASVIASLREQISHLENQVQSLKAELDATKCDRCVHHERRPEGIMHRPRAPTTSSYRSVLG
ncbi:hypothetical protein B0J17DRAFT_636393 [Rhizoctonia solani]|nr:hypothetical protein B0J17DRAFT_636393 [Rhizoctonia solani]